MAICLGFARNGTCREIQVNVAYRWFLRLRLTGAILDASTVSQNRRRRYGDTTVAQEIFDRIVEQAIGHGLVDSTVLYTDSTHLKANANKNKYDKAVVAKSRSDYWEALDAAITQERRERGLKRLSISDASTGSASALAFLSRRWGSMPDTLPPALLKG